MIGLSLHKKSIPKNEPEDNSDSKTSNESFDRNWELEQDTVKVGKEQLFLSLASHNGKLLSFSDNDRRHDNLDHVTDQDKGIIKGKTFPNCFLWEHPSSNDIAE